MFKDKRELISCIMHFSYQVALQTNELHPGLQVLVRVAAKNFEELHQVDTELVSSLQDAQHHYVAVPEVVLDVVGQTLDPAGDVTSMTGDMMKNSPFP